jgi:hypothetical protein
LFDGDAASGALRLGHDASGNPMVNVDGEPPLFAAAFLQQSPCGAGYLGLQPLSQPLLAFAVAVETRAG